MDWQRQIVFLVKSLQGILYFLVGGVYMKRILIGTVLTALVLSMGVTTAFAACRQHCMDTNGDGICDYHGIQCRYLDADGDGMCDNRGTGCHSGGHGRHNRSCW